jgi:hypothetical protein
MACQPLTYPVGGGQLFDVHSALSAHFLVGVAYTENTANKSAAITGLLVVFFSRHSDFYYVFSISGKADAAQDAGPPLSPAGMITVGLR